MSPFLDRMADVAYDLWNWVGNTNPDAWAAGAGWTTVAIASVASNIALRQVREARRLREEQAQPYVVAFMEASQASQHLIELVVKNFGTTAAQNVRMDSRPPLMRSSSGGGNPEEVKVFEVLPVLVPGQEWRIYWDSTVDRMAVELPEKYDVEIHYEDSQRRPLPSTPAVLDWGVYKSRRWLEIYGQHHAAKALREISALLKKSTETGGGFKVVARDGDAKDEQRRAQFAEFRAQQDALKAGAPSASHQQASRARTSPAKQDYHGADTTAQTRVKRCFQMIGGVIKDRVLKSRTRLPDRSRAESTDPRSGA